VARWEMLSRGWQGGGGEGEGEGVSGVEEWRGEGEGVSGAVADGEVEALGCDCGALVPACSESRPRSAFSRRRARGPGQSPIRSVPMAPSHTLFEHFLAFRTTGATASPCTRLPSVCDAAPGVRLLC